MNKQPKRSKITIWLEPELEHVFQECQRELDAAAAGRYRPEDRAQIMARHILGDDIYERQVTARGWTGEVTMLMEPKVAIKHALDWGIPTSKSAHVQKADFFSNLTQKMDREWNATVDMAIAAYGNGTGSLISGVYRDHFPDDVKNRLRFLHHGKNLAADAARLHNYLSKTHSPLFQ